MAAYFLEVIMYTEISNPIDYKVALYIRLSKEDDSEVESQSVTNQRSMLREFTQKQRLSVFSEYVDDGFSGGNFDRPAFNQLIEDIEAKKVNMVITKDMSRLGRDYIQTGYYMERYFPEKQVRYISLLDGIDTGIDNSMNDITPFKAIMNDMYAKDISKKIKSVKHDKQRKGLFIGGKAPYGYALSPDEKNTLIIDETAAEIVKMIFRFAVNGKSCREIAVTLNEMNIPTPATYANLNLSRKGPYSGKWSSERVTYTLKNQMYIGNMVQGTTKKVNYKSKKSIKIPKNQWIVVKNTHAPIIESEVFDKVQLMIESRNRTRSRTYDYLLKGIIFCKECGHPFGVINRVLSGNRPTLYFVCRTYQRFTKSSYCTCHCIRVDTVTNAILEKINEVCSRYINKNDFDEIAKKIYSEVKSQQNYVDEINRLSSQIDILSSKMDKIYGDKLSGLLDDNDFQRVYKKIRDDRSSLQNEIKRLQEFVGNDTNAYEYNLDDLINRFIESTGDNKELLVSLIEKIEMTEEKEIYIHFRFSELVALQEKITEDINMH